MADELPDLEVARQELALTLSGFGQALAEQARAHAETARSMAERARAKARWGWARSRDRDRALSLLTDVAGSSMDGSERWAVAAKCVLVAYRVPIPDHWGVRHGVLARELREPIDAVERMYWSSLRGALGVPVYLLHALHMELEEAADTLASLPAGDRPVRHPPVFARLRDDVDAESVAAKLTELIEEGLRQYDSTRAGQQPVLKPEWLWPEETGRSEPKRVMVTTIDRSDLALSRMFLTQAVTDRLVETAGLTPLEYFRTFLGSPAVITAAEAVFPQVYAFHQAVTVHYLTEVLKLMPDYAAASGQGPRRDPVTIYGNVGAINSQVSNSHLTVADTVTSIGATVQLVEDRGQTPVADALRALAQAIQYAPELSEEERAELLEHVADVADAVAAPDEPRKLSRAKAAMAVITNAAGASTQLAQVVATWHEVFSKLS